MTLCNNCLIVPIAQVALIVVVRWTLAKPTHKRIRYMGCARTIVDLLSGRVGGASDINKQCYAIIGRFVWSLPLIFGGCWSFVVHSRNFHSLPLKTRTDSRAPIAFIFNKGYVWRLRAKLPQQHRSDGASQRLKGFNETRIDGAYSYGGQQQRS